MHAVPVLSVCSVGSWTGFPGSMKSSLFFSNTGWEFSIIVVLSGICVDVCTDGARATVGDIDSVLA